MVASVCGDDDNRSESEVGCAASVRVSEEEGGWLTRGRGMEGGGEEGSVWCAKGLNSERNGGLDKLVYWVLYWWRKKKMKAKQCEWHRLLDRYCMVL